MTRSLKKNPFIAKHLSLVMGERRELNPRMVDSQSTALIHLATSAPRLFTNSKQNMSNHSPFFFLLR